MDRPITTEHHPLRTADHRERGAALAIVLGILSVLLIIVLWFYTSTRLQLKQAENVVNATRAELLADGAINIAVGFLNHDRMVHPTVTSLDHAWRTYFNGSWAAGKEWMWRNDIATGNPKPLVREEGVAPGLPEVDYGGHVLATVSRAIDNAPDDAIDPFTGGLIAEARTGPEAKYYLTDALAAAFWDWLYVPRVIGDPSEYWSVSADAFADAGQRPYVLSPDYGQSALRTVLGQNVPENKAEGFSVEQIAAFTDVDNDGDGFNDSIWIPMAQEIDLGGIDTDGDGVADQTYATTGNLAFGDGLDNDLDGEIDEPGELGLFIYWGGEDGRDNDGDGEVDEDDEQKIFLTCPLVVYGRDPNTGIITPSINIARFDVIRQMPNGVVERLTVDPYTDVDRIDNDYTLVVNEGSNTRYTGDYFPGSETTTYFSDTLQGLSVSSWIYAEPVSEIVGRAAIHIADESSKVNINAAGALTYDASHIDVAATPMRRALSYGLAPHEYEVAVIPLMGTARLSGLWNVKMGGLGYWDAQYADENIPSPRGFAVVGAAVGEENQLVAPGADPLMYDISLPGYGRVDDNGSILYMLTNGIDDDGDGYVDEGLVPEIDEDTGRTYYHPFEGLDEPFEYQLVQSLRNRIAEADGQNNNRNAINNQQITDEIGEFGDRSYRTSEQVMYAVENPPQPRRDPPAAQAEDLRGYFRTATENTVTAFSACKNLRFRYKYNDGSDVPYLGHDTTGLKLDYNYALPQSIFQMLKEDWGYPPLYDPLKPNVSDGRLRLLDSDDATSLDEAAGYFALGLRLEAQKMEVIEDALDAGVGIAGGFAGQDADAELRAMQLAVSTRDFSDSDYARSELTTTTHDTWWDIAGGEDNPREIKYTTAGIENIRINEIMVRPVRRIEAEMDMNQFSALGSSNPFYPNRFSAGTYADFSVFRQYFATGWAPVTKAGSTSPMGLDTAVEQTIAIDSVTSKVNIVEYRFAPSSMLPPGRYYLTVNTTDPNTGLPTVDASNSIGMRFAVKYGTYEYLTGKGGILYDLDFGVSGGVPLDLSSTSVLVNNNQVITDTNPDSTLRSAWVFLAPNTANPIVVTDAGGTDFLYNGKDRSAGEGYTPAYTVVIPEVAPDPANQEYLYVALWAEGAVSGTPLAINFFDFSQEPDHEYIELVNVAKFDPSRLAADQAIDLSGWELQVENASPITVGNGPLTMRIPDGTKIAPGGALLLTTNKFDDAYDDGIPQIPHADDESLIYRNGIGMARGELQTGINVPPALKELYRFITVPPVQTAFTQFGLALPSTQTVFSPDDYADFVDYDGDGVKDENSPEDAIVSSLDPFSGQGGAIKKWDRIVELDIPELASAVDLGTVARIVLGGGVFPNYPEEDGLDNDGDLLILASDGVNNNGNVDGGGAPQIDDPAEEEGVDEGGRTWVNAIPGRYSADPLVRYTLNADGSTFDADGDTYPYLGAQDDPPDWKAFVERRFFPGDCVMLTLYQGPAYREKIADRVTYTELDVINRAVDDILSATDAGFAAINPDYEATWPENTMGVDFYRALERWHPLYPGDRFGTTNRWEATDGNYDDWAPGTSLWERVLSSGAPDEANRLELADGTLRQMFASAFSGSPLQVNMTQRIMENTRGVFAQDPNPVWGYDTNDDEDFVTRVAPGFGVATVPNRNMGSPGDLLVLPHYYQEFPLSLPDAGRDTYALQGSQFLNERFDAPGNISVRANFSVQEVIAGQYDANGRNEDDRAALIANGGAVAPVVLTSAQADFAPDSPLGAFGGAYAGTGVYNWEGRPPIGWTPVMLFGLAGEETHVREVDRTALITPTVLFDWAKMRDTQTSRIFPELLADVDLAARWPMENGERDVYQTNYPRAVLFASGGDFSGGLPSERQPAAYFTWDGADGLSDGEYDVYVETCRDLDALRNHGLLTDEARDATVFNAVPRHADENMAEMKVDLTFYSDRNENNAFGIGLESGDSPAGFPNGVCERDEASGDSFGTLADVAPGPDGIIHYGIVRVTNNYLSMKIVNKAPAGRLNRFTRIILTPQKRSPGRINLNTATTRPVEAEQGRVRAFNALLGVPGILGKYDPAAAKPWSYPGESALTPPVVAEYASISGQFLRARVIAQGRTNHADGRYYDFATDILYDELLSAQVDPADVLRENIARYRRMSNMVTTRSDVFEIIVTVQAGYGVDADGDGYINYRSDDEFVITAEKQARTVYER